MSKDNTAAEKWKMKQQTRVKHEILQFYLKAFIAILSRPAGARQQTTLHFVDGFAGRGIYEGGEPGSPIIAMRVGQELHNHTQGRANLKIYCVEVEPENFSILQGEVGKAEPTCPKVEVKLYPGSFSQHVDQLLGQFRAGEPVFIFIDPFGYDDGIDVQTVLKLIQRPRTEVFVTLMSWFLNRFLSDAAKADRMTTVFGGEEWREIAAIENEKTQEKLVRLYTTNLLKAAEALGINDVIPFPVGVKFGDKDASVYHLIHFSRNPKARYEMERAVKNIKELTAVSMNSLEPLFFGMQQQHFESKVIDILKARGELEAIAVAGDLWRQCWDDNLIWDDQVRKVFLELEKQGAIEVRALGRNRKAGQVVKEKDRLRLRP